MRFAAIAKVAGKLTALWNMVVHVPHNALLAVEPRRSSALTVTVLVKPKIGKFKHCNEKGEAWTQSKLENARSVTKACEPRSLKRMWFVGINASALNAVRRSIFAALRAVTIMQKAQLCMTMSSAQNARKLPLKRVQVSLQVQAKL